MLEVIVLLCILFLAHFLLLFLSCPVILFTVKIEKHFEVGTVSNDLSVHLRLGKYFLEYFLNSSFNSFTRCSNHLVFATTLYSCLRNCHHWFHHYLSCQHQLWWYMTGTGSSTTGGLMQSNSIPTSILNSFADQISCWVLSYYWCHAYLIFGKRLFEMLDASLGDKQLYFNHTFGTWTLSILSWQLHLVQWQKL